MHLQPGRRQRGAEGRAGCAGRGGGPGTAPLTGTRRYANAHVLPEPRWAAPGEARSPRYAGRALRGPPGCEGRGDARVRAAHPGPPPVLPAPLRPGEAVSARCQLWGFIGKGRRNNEALSL